jgi:hypothetical protein
MIVNVIENLKEQFGTAWVDEPKSMKTDFFVTQAVQNLKIRGVGVDMMRIAEGYLKPYIDNIGALWIEDDSYSEEGVSKSVKSDNLIQYINARKKENAPEIAATMTWIYRRASRLGYPFVWSVKESARDSKDHDTIFRVQTKFGRIRKK